MRKVLSLIILIFLVFVTVSCNKEDRTDYQLAKISFDGYFDTSGYVVVEYDSLKTSFMKTKNRVYQKIIDKLEMLEEEFAGEVTDIDSVTKEINALAGKKDDNGNPIKTKVSKTFLTVLKAGINFSKEVSNYDITIGALTKLWDIGSLSEYCIIEGSKLCSLPNIDDINKAISKIDYSKVVIDENRKEVYISEEGYMLDFGSIAKGYAVGLLADTLNYLGYDFGIVNFGGNVKVYGESIVYKETNKDITIGVLDPKTDNDKVLNLFGSDKAVVTSGVNYRYINIDGITYSHLLDPTTGYPVINNLESVTIIGEDSMIADGLSTVCFVCGLNDGIKYLNSYGYDGIFITSDNRVYIVGDFEYQELSSNYEYIKVVFEGE